MLSKLPTTWLVLVLRATIFLIVVIRLVSSFVCVRIQINSHQLAWRDGPNDVSACRISMKTCALHKPAPVFKLNMPINLALYRVKMGRSVSLLPASLAPVHVETLSQRNMLEGKSSTILICSICTCTSVHTCAPTTRTCTTYTHTHTKRHISCEGFRSNAFCVLWMMSFPSVNG